MLQVKRETLLYNHLCCSADGNVNETALFEKNGNYCCNEGWESCVKLKFLHGVPFVQHSHGWRSGQFGSVLMLEADMGLCRFQKVLSI